MEDNSKGEFIPCTKWKPWPVMTFVDYEFTISGNDILFDERVIPEQLGVKVGDKFTVNISDFGRVMLIKEK